MDFKLNDFHRNTPDQELLDDLKSVATKLGRNNITSREYDEIGKYTSSTISTRFGKWNIALQLAGLELTLIQNISDKELLENIETIWIKLGKQPTSRDMKQPLSKYSIDTYVRRFNSWRKALQAFIEYINTDTPIQELEENISEPINEIVFKHKTKRNPSERLKVQVLIRDGNKCRLCGITLIGDNIHFDHILPWSKGGETTLENLQILCAPHNMAKGDL
jgi:hypothetical protein